MNLIDKAIDIKGKKYVLVSDRVLAFNEVYPNGSIKTSLISQPGADMVVIKAQVTPDCKTIERFFTGYSQAVWGEGMVNKTAALENAETSAVGRALSFMGIGVLDSIASFDEVKKAQSDIRNNKEPVTMKNRHCATHNSYWGATFPHCIKYKSGDEECEDSGRDVTDDF